MKLIWNLCERGSAKLNDADLLRLGQAAKFMCSPEAYFEQGPRQAFVIQLEEARAELERRNAEKEHNR